MVYQLLKLYSVYSTQITIALCAMIVLNAVYLLSRGGARAQIVPSISISLGIFFTFFGLALSLSAASNQNMKLTFMTLLSGLSTAFWTSVVGMFSSIMAKLILVGRAEKNTAIKGFQQDAMTVRRELSSLGSDITNQLKSSMAECNARLVEMFEQSASRVIALNHQYEQSMQKISGSLDQMISKIDDVVSPVHDVVTETEKLVIGTKNLVGETDALLSSNTQWVEDIRKSVGSICDMAPEAKAVFASIEKLNGSCESLSEAIDKKLEESQQKFGKDIEKITNEAINRMVGIEHEQHTRIVNELEKIDHVMKDTFDMVINRYGQGVVELLKKKQEAVANIVASLEIAKASNVDGLKDRNETSSTSTEVSV